MAFLAHIVCNYKLSCFIIFLNYFRQFAPKMCISGRVEYLSNTSRYNKIANTSASLSRTERRYPMRKKSHLSPCRWRHPGRRNQSYPLRREQRPRPTSPYRRCSMLETRQSLLAMLQTFETLAPGQFVSPGKGTSSTSPQFTS